MRRKLALHIILCAAAFSYSPPANAGQPVFDWLNFLLETATKEIAEKVRDLHVDELVLIGKELEYLKSAANPDIRSTFTNVRRRVEDIKKSSDALSNLIDSYGGIEKALEKFDSYKTFKNQPCFSSGTCTAEEVGRIRGARRSMQHFIETTAKVSLIETQKSSKQLSGDAKELELLEVKASRAKGQTQAIKYGNEIAAARAKELVQIRSSLNSIQRMESVRRHAQAQDRAATIRRFERFKGIQHNKDQNQ